MTTSTSPTLRPFPTHIQIQTTVACGADCTICPHPDESPGWSNGAMSETLFDKIVSQLSGKPIEYVSPYLMADPLSDRRIFERTALIRNALPDTHIEISTTGMYLVPKLAERLLDAPLSELRISSHGICAEEYAQTMPGVDFSRAMPQIEAFIRAWQETRPYKLSIVCLWGMWSQAREREIEAYWQARDVELSRWRLISRSNQVDLTIFGERSPDPTPLHDGKHTPPYVCKEHRDTKWMHILSDGRVALCCMDYAQEAIVGDLSAHTLEEIWSSSTYNEIRGQIAGHQPMPDDFLCQRCEWHVSESSYRQYVQNKTSAAGP